MILETYIGKSFMLEQSSPSIFLDLVEDKANIKIKIKIK